MAQCRCEDCLYYVQDEEADTWLCERDLDEDEWYAYCVKPGGRCPYYRPGGGQEDDGYALSRRQ